MAMVIVSVWWTYASDRYAWSKSRRPLTMFLHLSHEPDELSLRCKHDDSTGTILLLLLLWYYS